MKAQEMNGQNNIDFPLISVITPCLNRGHMIEEAIESVLSQHYPNVEHIIVDGGSKDSTLERLKKYNHLKVTSEPDKNLYDGLNKGIMIAKGEFIGHLNSDDRFAPNCFHEIAETFRAHPNYDSVCGNAIIFEIQNGKTEILHRFDSEQYKQLTLENITVGKPIINARFFRKKVYQNIGLYDIRYRIAADREFLLRAYLNSIKTKPMDRDIYEYRQHLDSLTFSNSEQQLAAVDAEYFRIIQQYSGDLNLPSEVRRAALDWHTLMVGNSMMQSFRTGGLKKAINLAISGSKFDAWFLPRFIPRYTLQFLKRRLNANA